MTTTREVPMHMTHRDELVVDTPAGEVRIRYRGKAAGKGDRITLVFTLPEALSVERAGRTRAAPSPERYDDAPRVIVAETRRRGETARWDLGSEWARALIVTTPYDLRGRSPATVVHVDSLPPGPDGDAMLQQVHALRTAAGGEGNTP